MHYLKRQFDSFITEHFPIVFMIARQASQELVAYGALTAAKSGVQLHDYRFTGKHANGIN